GQQECEAVAGDESFGDQQTGQSLDAGGEIAKCYPALAIHHGQVAGIEIGRAAQGLIVEHWPIIFAETRGPRRALDLRQADSTTRRPPLPTTRRSTRPR